ncbi:alanine racemase [uncultured Nitratireductor sp.]|uniref:alanine racemase n=1 Tax=uncultured Nitratireductor sp. TaxID=520953 RepID=UPI0025DF65DA|nr:alanine racemase [uncultured Nitratireductor sp.]
MQKSIQPCVGLGQADAAFCIDDTLRGVPAGTVSFAARDVAESGWSASGGDLSYPVLTVSGSAYTGNRDAIFAYAKTHGALLAPHIKTPMSVDIAHDLVGSGAWGMSVADLQQASVMLRGGIKRLLIANQLGGERMGDGLARLLNTYPDAEVVLFADSEASLAVADRAGKMSGRVLPVLIEVGLGRAGLRDVEQARKVVGKALTLTHVRLGGVAAYEGAVASADPAATVEAIGNLNDLLKSVFDLVRSALPERRLALSSGGSQYFDLVVNALSPLARSDGNVDFVLRSGAIFFHDHGVYAQALERMDARSGFALAGESGALASRVFQPAMRVWAQVLSRPENDLAICGIGMRDVSFDQGFPVALKSWRDGSCNATLDGIAEIEKLNDQHGFLRLKQGADVKVGDIIEFGISHPCTCFDRWRHFFVVDDNHRVTSVHATSFG